ncbi:MAG: acetyltransferase [Bacillota bacterium]
MSGPVIVIGSGGHARVLIDALSLQTVEIFGITDLKPEKAFKTVYGLPLIGKDDAIFEYKPDKVQLVNGLGSVRDTAARKKIYEYFKSRGYKFATIIHPSAVIASDVTIEEGSQIMAGSIIQTGTCIGHNTIVNTKASVDHDCFIGPHVHLAPGVTLSGGVEVGEGVHIGTGAAVIQGIRIGQNSIIGAGAVVVKDVPEGAIVTGVPARVVSP